MKRLKTMMLIIVVYVSIMYLLTLLYGCMSNEKTPKQESAITYTDSSEKNLDKLEDALKKSDTTLGNIEKTMSEHDQLIQENKKLKAELKTTKDSLVATKKLLKKRTLLQQIIHPKNDTVNNK